MISIQFCSSWLVGSSWWLMAWTGLMTAVHCCSFTWNSMSLFHCYWRTSFISFKMHSFFCGCAVCKSFLDEVNFLTGFLETGDNQYNMLLARLLKKVICKHLQYDSVGLHYAVWLTWQSSQQHLKDSFIYVNAILSIYILHILIS